jgi:hypothetical protein
MIFSYLSESLWPTAEAAARFFHENWGIALKAFNPETNIHPSVEMVPALHAATKDHHILCIEVSDGPVYYPALDAFVLECQDNELPVKLYVVTPEGAKDLDYKTNRNTAQRRGVGLIETEKGGPRLIQEALSLSLSNVRHLDLSDYTPAARADLAKAERLFRHGDPELGCLQIQLKLEEHTRRFAEKTYMKGMWSNKPSVNFEKHPWRNLCQLLQKYLQFRKVGSPECNEDLVTRIMSVVPQRNQGGHPISLKQRIKRDRELRTRFENAADILRELTLATRRFRI